MKKVYGELTEEQKNRGVIFSSQLVVSNPSFTDGKVFEVFSTDKDKIKKIARLKNDSSFDDCGYEHNLICS